MLPTLERAERALDLGQGFVMAHTISTVHPGDFHRSANDVDTIQRRLRSDALCLALEAKRLIRDIQRDVLGDLVLIDHLADTHTDLVLAAQATGLHLSEPGPFQTYAV